MCTPSGSLELREDRLRVDALLLAERVERAAHIGAALLRLPELLLSVLPVLLLVPELLLLR